MQGLTEGRIVHYTAYTGCGLAAIVTGHTAAGVCDLVVFTNMQNSAGVKNGGVQFHFDVEYSAEARPGTWHWPPHK